MSETIRRTFDIALARAGADQRIVGGCVVPYNTPTLVSDDGGATSYREMFVPGAFARSVGATGRLPLNYRHMEGLLDRVGVATSLEERPEMLWGLFRVFGGVVGDHALTLVDEGVLTGLSVEGVARRTTRRADGVVVREAVQLAAVALCEEPAYAEAGVSVRRTRADLDLPPAPDPAQVARLAAVGIRVPSR